MAIESRGLSVGYLVAAADLSAKQFCLVKIDAAGKVALAGLGDACLGVLQNAPASGEACDVMTEGTSKVVASGALAAGDLVGSDANGKAVVAGAGEFAAGVLASAAGGADVYATLVLKSLGKQ